MKKTFLLSILAGTLLSGNVFAQDMTPAKFKFSELPAGAWEYSGQCSSFQESNPPPKFAEAKSDEGGYSWLFGWYNSDKAFTFMKNATQVVDMGGEVGKVFCIKGDKCSTEVFNYGTTPAEPDGGIGWPTLAFFYPVKLNGAPFPAGTNKGRLTVVWKQFLPEDLYTDQKNTLNISIKDYSGSVIKDLGCQTDYTYEENVWCKQEIDFDINFADVEKMPLYLKVGFLDDEYIRNGAVCIKELRMTFKPAGTAIDAEQITLTPGPGGVADITASEISYIVNGDNLQINNLKGGEAITLYNAAGVQLNSVRAAQDSQSIALDQSGFYILKVDSKSVKFIKR